MGALDVNFIIISVGLVIGVAFQVLKKYVVTTFQWSKNKPKELASGFIGGALYFCYNMFTIIFSLPLDKIAATANSSATLIILMRSSLVFAGFTMLFGPFLIIPPIKAIVLQKKTFFKALVEGAQKEETRYTAFAIFCVISALQGFVVFSLWQLLLIELQQELRLVLGIVIGYTLVSLFYLVIMYSVMMKKDVVIKGINLLEQIRRNCVIRRRGKPDLNLLDNKYYVKIYLACFCFCLAGSIAMIAYIGVFDFLNPMFIALDTLGKVIVVGFFVIICLALIVYTIFILNVAFRPVPVSDVVLSDGTVISTSLIRYVLIARSNDRVILLERGQKDDPQNTELQRELHRIVQDPFTRTDGSGEWTLTIDQHGVDACVHQDSDLACMHFVAVGLDYPKDIAIYFLSELKLLPDLWIEKSRDEASFNAHKPDTWLNSPSLRESVEKLVKKFMYSNKKERESLKREANEACGFRDEHKTQVNSRSEDTLSMAVTHAEIDSLRMGVSIHETVEEDLRVKRQAVENELRMKLQAERQAARELAQQRMLEFERLDYQSEIFAASSLRLKRKRGIGFPSITLPSFGGRVKSGAREVEMRAMRDEITAVKETMAENIDQILTRSERMETIGADFPAGQERFRSLAPRPPIPPTLSAVPPPAKPVPPPAIVPPRPMPTKPMPTMPMPPPSMPPRPTPSMPPRPMPPPSMPPPRPMPISATAPTPVPTPVPASRAAGRGAPPPKSMRARRGKTRPTEKKRKKELMERRRPKRMVEEEPFLDAESIPMPSESIAIPSIDTGYFDAEFLGDVIPDRITTGDFDDFKYIPEGLLQEDLILSLPPLPPFQTNPPYFRALVAADNQRCLGSLPIPLSAACGVSVPTPDTADIDARLAVLERHGPQTLAFRLGGGCVWGSESVVSRARLSQNRIEFMHPGFDANVPISITAGPIRRSVTVAYRIVATCSKNGQECSDADHVMSGPIGKTVLNPGFIVTVGFASHGFECARDHASGIGGVQLGCSDLQYGFSSLGMTAICGEVSAFGPQWGVGDVILTRLELCGDCSEVHFAVNGLSLGSFSLADVELHPAISVAGVTGVVIESWIEDSGPYRTNLVAPFTATDVSDSVSVDATRWWLLDTMLSMFSSESSVRASRMEAINAGLDRPITNERIIEERSWSVVTAALWSAAETVLQVCRPLAWVLLSGTRPINDKEVKAIRDVHAYAMLLIRRSRPYEIAIPVDLAVAGRLIEARKLRCLWREIKPEIDMLETTEEYDGVIHAEMVERMDTDCVTTTNNAATAGVAVATFCHENARWMLARSSGDLSKKLFRQTRRILTLVDNAAFVSILTEYMDEVESALQK